VILHVMLSRVFFTLQVCLLVASCNRGDATPFPPGMIAMFDHECPDGWTRYQQMDGRFARGGLQAGETGGDEGHIHSFDVTARTSKDGAHVHMLAAGEPVDVDPGAFGSIGLYDGFLQAFEEGGRDRTKASRARTVTDTSGAHDHLISVQGETEPKLALPPYIDLVFCRKE